MPPDPTFTFSIPSVHDDTLLECRIYTPPFSFFLRSHSAHRQIVGGAVVAHPYASFGGCYDDHVVLDLVAETLGQGLVVGTFNFRGAGGSKGKTSWTSKPEIYDYVSFVGFFIHYLSALRLPEHGESLPASPSTLLAPISTSEPLGHFIGRNHDQMTLILSGYSYGSLIAMQLPAIEVMLNRFAHVQQGTSEAEIRLRADNLANQWNKAAQTYSNRHRDSILNATNMHAKSPRLIALAIGGEESEPGSRRSSRESKRRSGRESKRSLDLVRKSFERAHIHIGRTSREIPALRDPPDHLVPALLVAPRICYLLVSPLLPPISSLATLFTISAKSMSSPAARDISQRLASHSTMAIYGDNDFFVSQKKLRLWSETISRRPSSLFRCHEVAGAGHFWRDIDAEAELRRLARDWVGDILR